MSDVHDQIARVRTDSDIPVDSTNEEPPEADLAPDRTRQFTHTSFSRMRAGWIGDDRDKVLELEALADEMVERRFAVVLAVLERIRRHVRTQAHDEDAVLLTYSDGAPVWEKDEFGVPVEDWTLLSDRDRLSILGIMHTHMYEWEMAATNLWADAMYSKAIWEEAFAQGFTAIPPGVVTGKPTVDDRTQWGHKNAAQERYFALFQSSMSRKAEAILRVMRGMQYMLEKTASR